MVNKLYIYRIFIKSRRYSWVWNNDPFYFGLLEIWIWLAEQDGLLYDKLKSIPDMILK